MVFVLRPISAGEREAAAAGRYGGHADTEADQRFLGSRTENQIATAAPVWFHGIARQQPPVATYPDELQCGRVEEPPMQPGQRDGSIGTGGPSVACGLPGSLYSPVLQSPESDVAAIWRQSPALLGLRDLPSEIVIAPALDPTSRPASEGRRVRPPPRLVPPTMVAVSPLGSVTTA